MKVNISLELDDERLRRIRAALGRGGTATRSEVRVWVDRLVQGGLRAAPEPKRRRVAAPKPEPTPEPEPDVEVTDETPCRHCQRQRQSHGKMMGTCLPGFGAAPGSRFSPARG
jgi:hypothetical protein